MQAAAYAPCGALVLRGFLVLADQQLRKARQPGIAPALDVQLIGLRLGSTLCLGQEILGRLIWNVPVIELSAMKTPCVLMESSLPSPSPGRMRLGARYDRLTEFTQLHMSPGSDAITANPLMTGNYYNVDWPASAPG